MKKLAMPTHGDLLRTLERGYELPPLRVGLAQSAPDPRLDARVEVTAGDRLYQFDAELRTRSTPRIFEEALLRLAESARRSNRRGMLIVPYLRESQLEALRERQLSGLDLSGNGIVIVPGELLVYRTGKPNCFREVTPTRFAYRGATSLVARAFLCRPVYDSLTDIVGEIERRGSRIVVSTVSKALKRMESDLIVERDSNGLRLRQPEKLLDSLRQDYRAPRVTQTVTLAVANTTWEQLVRHDSPDVPLAFTGKTSLSRYVAIEPAIWPVLYTTHVDRLLKRWGNRVCETSVCVELELQQTDDPTVYFDPRHAEGLPYAPPLQAYLEASANGVQRDSVEALRRLILAQHNLAENEG